MSFSLNHSRSTATNGNRKNNQPFTFPALRSVATHFEDNLVSLKEKGIDISCTAAEQN